MNQQNDRPGTPATSQLPTNFVVVGTKQRVRCWARPPRTNHAPRLCIPTDQSICSTPVYTHRTDQSIYSTPVYTVAHV